MAQTFKTLITQGGAQKMAASGSAIGKKIILTDMAVGDGGGILPQPEASQTALINERWRGKLNQLTQLPDKPDTLMAELIIPPQTGGFWMRELGLYDEDNLLFAVANMPESYKPEPSEGAARSQTVRMIINASSFATVTVSVDSSTVLATLQYVDNKINEHEKSRRHPDASLTEKGLIQLCSETDNASETLAATPLAVKTVNENASCRIKKSGDTLSGELVSNVMDNYRIKAGNRAFFQRFDGNDFYLLKTAAGDPDGLWDAARPLRVNANTGRVFLPADTRVEGRIYAQDAALQTDGNVYGSLWGGFLNNWINARINSTVTDIRLGAQGEYGRRGGWYGMPDGWVVTGVFNNGNNYVGSIRARPIQKCVNGQWYNIGYL